MLATGALQLHHSHRTQGDLDSQKSQKHHGLTEYRCSRGAEIQEN